MATLNLLSTTSRVATPFVIADIGGYAFGKYIKNIEKVIDTNGFTRRYVETFPNYIQSLTVDKVNGTVNTYNLTLVYAIRAGDDPNKIDKILSSVSSSRKITISYGDLSTPHYIYKDEEALITNVTSSVDIQTSTITYVITAVSSSSCLATGTYSFSKRTAKPSDVIKEILYKQSYGALDVFYGMRDKSQVLQKNLIASDDKSVIIQAKTNISVFDYITYLVSCMSCVTDSSNSITGKHRYTVTVVDDTSGEFSGPYFKVTKVASTVKETNSLNAFEVNIGYPSGDIVLEFSINDNQAYSILYNYASKIQQPDYVYRINDEGEYDYIYSPTLSNSKNLYISTEADKNWWSQVTSYPISATLKLKGLLKPALLMTYIKVNLYFYGQRHNATGTYIITAQRDEVSFSGFTTTLSLTRIQGEEV